jgi:hypothetical protein
MKPVADPRGGEARREALREALSGVVGGGVVPGDLLDQLHQKHTASSSCQGS